MVGGEGDDDCRVLFGDDGCRMVFGQGLGLKLLCFGDTPPHLHDTGSPVQMVVFKMMACILPSSHLPYQPPMADRKSVV